MEKDIIRNLSIGFFIGALLGWWWTREILTAGEIILAMIIIGLIGAGFGYIEAISKRKRNENIAISETVKWWQQDVLNFSNKSILILFVIFVIIIMISMLLLMMI